MNNPNKDYTKTQFSTHFQDVAGDYILPDSYKDVKTVLSSTARISEINKYFGPADAQLSGNLVYNIVFTTASDNGKDEINSINFEQSFKQTCRYTAEANTGVGALTVSGEMVCRMANPRKFSIKSVLKTIMFEDIAFNTYPKISGVSDNENIEYKVETSNIPGCYCAALTEHSFSDNIELDMKAPEIDKIINYDVKLSLRDERNGKAPQFKLGGIFILHVIYLDTAGNYQFINKDIPFNISLNQDELLTLAQSENEMLGILPSVTLSAVNLNVGKNQYDEAKVLEFDADYDIDMFVFTTNEIAYVADAYSTEYDCECKLSDEEFLTDPIHISTNFTNSDYIQKAAVGMQENTTPSVLNEQVYGVEHNGEINGKISARTVFLDENETYRSKDITSGFAYKTDMPEGCMMMGECFAANTKVRTDTDKLYTDSEIYMDYVLSEITQKTVCREIIVSEEAKKAHNDVFSIYFPNESDTLWDCAKAKKVSIDSLLQSNPNINDKNITALLVE